MTARRAPGFWTVVLLVAVAIVFLLLVWPLSSILSASFIDNATRAPTLANYCRVPLPDW